MVCDGQGGIYVADTGNHRVRSVSASGTIATVAGTGTSGYSGDGSSAAVAKLSAPAGIAVGSQGDVLVVDTGNYRLRRVTSAGVITTMAGNGTHAWAGDGGPATEALLDYPEGLAVDSQGNIYFADSSSRIRKIGINGVITTVAGNGTAGFAGDGGAAINAQLYFPSAVAIDGQGNIFVADTLNRRVRKVDASGIITTYAGYGLGAYLGDGGPATSAALNYVKGLALDAQGNLYIADVGDDRIRRVSTEGVITTVAGKGTPGFAGDGGAATSALLDSPWGVVFDSGGNMYIADEGNQRVRKVDTSGKSRCQACSRPRSRRIAVIFCSSYSSSARKRLATSGRVPVARSGSPCSCPGHGISGNMKSRK